MENPFNHDPFVSPSMNQVKLMALPNVRLPAEVQGKRSYDLLSANALRGRIIAGALMLKLDSNAVNLFEQFDACFDDNDPTVREVAEEIGRESGRFLAYHLLTLKQGAAASQAARPDWQPQHWAWWAQIEQVWLGGGLLAGQLGQVMLAEAQQQISPYFPSFQLHLAAHAAHLPLLGVARTLPIEEGQALVFDFGQTAVKRAVAMVTNGRLHQLCLLPSLPSECGDLFAPATIERAQARLAFMLRTITQTWQGVKMPLHPALAVSVSSYLWNGHPRGDSGCYGCISLLCDNMEQTVATGVSEQLKQAVKLRLVHDGHAAGLTQASMLHSAVLTFGTALGIGFPPRDAEGLIPLDPAFDIDNYG